MLLVIQSPELSKLITPPLISFKLPRCGALIKTSNIPLEEEGRKCRRGGLHNLSQARVKRKRFHKLKKLLIPLKLTHELAISNGPVKNKVSRGRIQRVVYIKRYTVKYCIGLLKICMRSMFSKTTL